MAFTAPKGHQTPQTPRASGQATTVPTGLRLLLPCPLPRDRKGLRPEAATEKVSLVPLARNMRTALLQRERQISSAAFRSSWRGQSQAPVAGWLGEFPMGGAPT